MGGRWVFGSVLTYRDVVECDKAVKAAFYVIGKRKRHKVGNVSQTHSRSSSSSSSSSSATHTAESQRRIKTTKHTNKLKESNMGTSMKRLETETRPTRNHPEPSSFTCNLSPNLALLGHEHELVSNAENQRTSCTGHSQLYTSSHRRIKFEP